VHLFDFYYKKTEYDLTGNESKSVTISSG